MNKYYSRFCLSIAAALLTSVCFSQTDLVLNGAYVVLNGGSHATPIYLDINDNQTGGITNLKPSTAGNGGIISENEFNQVKWEIQNQTSAATAYVVPFSYSTTNPIPVSMLIPAGGTGNGSVEFSTYGGEPSGASEWKNSAYMPTDVTNMKGQCFADDSKFATDRFWIVDAKTGGGYTTLPTVDLTFTYLASENSNPGGNDITPAKFQAQRYNSGTNTWWDWIAAKNTNAGSTVTSGTVIPGNFYRSWTLISQHDSVTPQGTSTACTGIADTLKATYGDAISYSWSTGPGVTTPTLSVTSAAVYTDSVTRPFGCIFDTATKVNENPSPAITISPAPNASPNDSICQGTPLSFTVGGGGTYKWIGTGNTTNNATATPINDTTFSVAVTNGGCTKDSNFTIAVSAPVVATITTPLAFCTGDSIQIKAGSLSSYTYSWSPSTGLWPNANVQDPYASPGSNKTYTVTIKNGVCSATENAVVTVNETPTISVIGTGTIVSGSTQNIGVTSLTSTDTYVWAPSNTLSNSTIANPVATPTATTTYTVTATNSTGGCPKVDSVTVYVKENCGPIYMPTAFSPNDDHVNDVLLLMGKCVQTMDLNIFDRWGNKVFSSTNQLNGWDGTYQGKPMNTATYVFELSYTDINNVTTTKKGNVTLVR